VLFGSNYPFWPAPDCFADLDRLDLDDATKKAFLDDNAATVFHLT
jgi:predicted TIM-barrel fold metal-dependent hydrolase